MDILGALSTGVVLFNKNKDIVFLNNAAKTITKKENIIPLYERKINIPNIEVSISKYKEEYILMELVKRGDEVYFLSKLAEKSQDLLSYKNKSLYYTYLNIKLAEFLNIDKDYLPGKSDDDLLKEGIYTKEQYELSNYGDLITLRDGFYQEVEKHGNKYFMVMKELIDEGIFCSARDVTEETIAKRRAEVDNLTGLYNRYKLGDYIENVYKDINKHYFIAVFDLDDLKELNNACGHLMGDKYLKSIGQILLEFSEGRFFRIGGDEFLGLLPLETQNEVEGLIKRIYNEIKSLKLTPPLSVSIGVTSYNKNKTIQDNFHKADMILYKAKGRGKNTFIIE